MRRRIPKRFELDDLRGAGYLGLLSAAERYSADRCRVPFHVYAWRRIHDAILDSVRAGRDHDAYQGFEVAEIPEMPCPPNAETEALRGEVTRAVSALPSREREIIERHYFDMQESLAAIGEALGISRWTANNLKRSALKRLREQLEWPGRKAA